MPVVFFSEKDGTVPVLAWMDALQSKVQDKCLVKIERLEEMGHELRRPEADYLRDDIHELRIAFRSIQYRILYFFHGGLAVLLQGLQKENEIPPREIEIAIRRKELFIADPQMHTYEEDENERKKESCS